MAGDESGFASTLLDGGAWIRTGNVFVKRIKQGDMESVLGAKKAIDVPPGSLAAVYSQGKVEKVMGPGFQTTVGWWKGLTQSITGTIKGGTPDQRTAFFLIDQRSVPVPLVVEAAGPDTSTRVKLQVLLEARATRDTTQIERLVEFMGSEEVLTADQVHARVLPVLEKASRGVLAGHQGADYESAAVRIRDQVAQELPELVIDVRVSPVSAVASIDVHLGAVQSPDVRPCVEPGCRAELPATLKFCTTCGAQQPTLKSPDRACTSCRQDVPPGMKFCIKCGEPYQEKAKEDSALFTADGQQVEVDLVLRAQGDGFASAGSADGVRDAISSSARKFLRGVDYAHVTSPQGFQDFEDLVAQDSGDSLRALGMRMVEVNVLDVKSKNGEWMLGARADMVRARDEVTLGREWLAVSDESLDLQSLTNEIALKQMRVQRDHSFAELEATLSDNFRRQELQQEAERRSSESETDHRYDLDTVDLRDRSRRQEQLDSHSEMDVADAQRESDAQVKIDQAGRISARHARDQDHVDEMERLEQDSQQRARSAQINRTEEAADLDHRIDSERKVDGYSDERERQKLKLASDATRQGVDDAVYAEESARDVAFKDDQRRRELDEHSKDREAERELSAEERRAKIQADKLAALAESEAKLQSQEQAHAQSMREMLASNAANLSADQLLALQATELGRSDHGQAAFEALASRGRAEEAEKAREEDREFLLRLRQEERETAERNADRLADALKSSSAETRDALKQAAEQAQSMSEASMDAMKDVAATASGQRPNPSSESASGSGSSEARTPAAEQSCKECQAALQAPFAFCGACGTKQD